MNPGLISQAGCEIHRNVPDFLPANSDGRLFAVPWRANARSIVSGGVVKRDEPSAQFVDADGTYVDVGGVIRQAIINRLRIEGKGGLLEETRENIIYPASDYATGWSNSGTVIATDVAVAPDGTTEADSLEDNSAGVAENIFRAVTVPATTQKYTTYAYIKKAAAPVTNRPCLLLFFTGPSIYFGISVNPYTGVITTLTSGLGLGWQALVGSSIESFNDDWWRVSVTGANANNTTLRHFLVPTGATDAAPSVYAVAPVGTNVFWGAQTDPNALLPLSYIPTVGAAVTRMVDSLKYPMPGNLASTGTLIMAVTPVSAGAGEVVYLDTRDPADGTDGIVIEENPSGKLRAFVIADGTGDIVSSITVVAGQTYVLAVTWSSGVQEFFVDGVSVGTASGAGVPDHDGATFTIGAAYLGSFNSSSNFAHFSSYDRVLPDEEIVQATNEINGWLA